MTKGTHSYIEDKRNEHIKIYVNGNTYSRNKAVISVFDSGFLLGDGVWEGIRLLNGHLVFIKEHLDRLYHGAKKLAIKIASLVSTTIMLFSPIAAIILLLLFR